MKKPKKSGSDYYNYKGFFSLVIVLVDAEYRFLLIDCGLRGSSSDTHIFNRSNLMEKIEDGSFRHLNHWGERRPDLHYFLLGGDAFVLMSWIVKPYSRRQLTREERIANYRISRGRRLVENAFGILVSQFRVLPSTMEQRPKVVRVIMFTCVVLHNIMRTHQEGADRAPTKANDAAALQNEQVVYVPNKNYRNPLREAK